MKTLEKSLQDLRDIVTTLENKVVEQYPTFEDVLQELRLRECCDEEIAFWLGAEDPKLGVRPLELIQQGDIEAVYRRLRNDQVD